MPSTIASKVMCRGMHTTTALRSNRLALAGRCVSALSDAYLGRKIIPFSTNLVPSDLGEAYSIQRGMIAELSKQHIDVVGWKIGATMLSQQSRLGISSPFYGPLFSDNLETSPATLRTGTTFRLRGVECEYVFRMKHSLPPSKKDYTEQEVLEAVSDIFPAIEVCGSRVAEHNAIMLTIADQASHGRLIIAPHLSIRASDWPAFSKNFKANPARLSINDAEVASGDGSLVLGNPLSALTWLANTLKDNNMHLKADDVVTSGTMTGLTPIQHGDSVVADFGGFGKVKLQLAPLA